MNLRIFLSLLLVLLARSKLLYLAQLFRHGARYTTADLYDANETKHMAGNLTAVGMRQQYLLGSYLRQDYLEQLGLNPQFDPTQVEVFAQGGSLRCIESAYAHMGGWFPVGEGEQLPDGVDEQLLKPPFQALSGQLMSEPALEAAYQPIPVKLGKQGPFPDCPRLTEIIAERVAAVAEKLAVLESEQQLFANKMRNIFKIPLKYDNLGGLIQLYDVVAADLNLGRKLPADFTDQDFLQLKYVQNYFLILIYGEQLARVVSTPVATLLLHNMQQRIDGNLPNRKLTVFSGHDTNVAPMLSFLNLSDAECVQRKYRNQTVTGNCAQPVPFASSIQFELHSRSEQSEAAANQHPETASSQFPETAGNQYPETAGRQTAGNYYVRVRYNGQYYRVCGSNSTECEFTVFESRVRAALVNHEKLCGTK